MNIRLNKTMVALASSALLLVSVPVAGITAAANATAKPTYTIGYQGPLSGGNAQLGLNMEYGVQLAIQQANASGKYKFKLRFQTLDDQGDPSVAPGVAQGAVANSNLVALVGPSFSGATAASMPYYGPANIAMVSASATRTSLTDSTQNPNNNTFFRVVADDSVQGPADAKYLVKTKKITKLYVVDDGSSYGQGVASQVSSTATALHATVTTASVPGTTQCQAGNGATSEYSAAATAVVNSHATGLFYGGYYCDLGLFLGALKTAGYHGVIMSDDGALSSSLVSGTTPHSAANNVLISCACASSTNAAFNTAYENLAGFPATNATYAAEAYDAANAIIKAMSQLTTITRGGIVAKLKARTFTSVGITKTIKFQSNGNISGSAIYVTQVVNGVLKQLGLE
jgi:branched-chain amino acid transport system substrate-binding protein